MFCEHRSSDQAGINATKLQNTNYSAVICSEPEFVFESFEAGTQLIELTKSLCSIN